MAWDDGGSQDGAALPPVLCLLASVVAAECCCLLAACCRAGATRCWSACPTGWPARCRRWSCWMCRDAPASTSPRCCRSRSSRPWRCRLAGSGVAWVWAPTCLLVGLLWQEACMRSHSADAAAAVIVNIPLVLIPRYLHRCCPHRTVPRRPWILCGVKTSPRACWRRRRSTGWRPEPSSSLLTSRSACPPSPLSTSATTTWCGCLPSC